MQKNKKDLSLFGFSQFFNHHFIQTTPKKKALDFLFFHVSRSKQKKGKTKKKTNMGLRPSILWKVLFFWFSRGVFDFVNGVFPRSLQILFFVGFLEFLKKKRLSLWILSQRVVKYCFFPMCFDNVQSYYPQDIFEK